MKQVYQNSWGLFIVFSILCIFLLSACRQSTKTQDEALSEQERRLPENATSGLTLASGLDAELFASEPMMTNPTNMDIDAYGRVWICEGYNYRAALNPGQVENPEGDRIVILEDLDGDGRADTSIVFYQGTDINSALGIAVLGNQVIVSVSPKVLIFTDLDGDGRADKKEVLFEGIEGEQHDHGVHAFVFGPDGKLYFNFGNEGQQLKDKNGKLVKDRSGRPVQASGDPYRQGMIIRCNLDGSELEVLGHNFRNNYELAVDAFGNIWQSDNDDDGNESVRINYILEYGNYGYTDERTGASWQQYRINQEEDTPGRHWHQNDPGVVPNLLHTGAGSPTGILVYEGDLLPAAFRNQIIHADALPNVVRAYPVEKKGAGFTARIENLVKSEHDQWFRPSDVTVAPDGSLFIADWYDPGVGGHQVGDLNRGRVFRVAPPGTPYKVSAPLLSTPAQAAEALKSPNSATRYLAWQKLHEWKEEAIPALEELLASENPRYQARALWLLSKLDLLGMSYIKEALDSSNEDIRITAIRAARQRGEVPLELLAPLVRDASPQVRAAALIALRHHSDPQAAQLWARLAGRYQSGDRWYLEALGIAAQDQWEGYLDAYLQQGSWNTPEGRDIIWRARSPKALELLSEILQNGQLNPVQGLKFFRALDFYPPADKQRVLAQLLKAEHPQQELIDAFSFLELDTLSGLHRGAGREKLLSALQAVKNRPEFIRLAQKYKIRQAQPVLLERAFASPADAEAAEALNTALELGGSTKVRERLLSDTANAERLIGLLSRTERKLNQDLIQERLEDQRYPMPLRIAAAKALLVNWSGEDRMLLLLQQGRLPGGIDSLAIKHLSTAYRPEIKEQMRGYAVQQERPERNVKEWASLKGEASRGAAVYTAYCASCHLAADQGVDFGPNLSSIGKKLAKDALYTAILEPDAGISFGYEAYNVEMKDGKKYLGFIASETDQSLTVKTVGGSLHPLKKTDILSQTPYPHSLMPSGLDKSMSEQQLVDLVEYLSGLGV